MKINACKVRHKNGATKEVYLIDNSELVGKTLKSKINGNIFVVDGEFEDSGQKFYSILDLASGAHFASGKEWFEKGIMQNLEIVEN